MYCTGTVPSSSVGACRHPLRQWDRRDLAKPDQAYRRRRTSTRPEKLERSALRPVVGKNKASFWKPKSVTLGTGLHRGAPWPPWPPWTVADAIEGRYCTSVRLYVGLGTVRIVWDGYLTLH